MAELHRFTREAMACTFALQVAGEEHAAAEAAGAAWEEVDRLEMDLSRFVTTSDVSRINIGAGKKAMRISTDTWDVLVLADLVWEQTGGAFDVTWGSSRKLAPGERPVILDHDELTAYVEAGRRVDLGAIGKGYALDIMAERLRRWGVEKAVLSSGDSTVLAVGEFEVALRDPNQGRVPLGKVRLKDYALSGSGMLIHGAHIIDPRTGAPATGRVATWAAAPSGAVSDALSTAFMVMPPAAVEAFCGKFADVAGMVIDGGGVKKWGKAAGAEFVEG
jgi:FAD:protein FMN transferase